MKSLRLALFVLLLAACATEPIPPQPGPPTVSIPSPSPDNGVPAGPTVTPGDGETGPAPVPETAGPPPPAADVHWEVIGEEQGRLSQLVGLPAPAVAGVPSPDGRWWVTSVVQEELEAGPPYVSLYVLDSEADEHWIASERRFGLLHAFDWMPDGRLLWTDEGHLYIADSNGYHRRELAAPEAVHEVWYGGQSTALVGGETKLWRVNLDEDTWDRVEDDSNGAPSISRGSANLAISPDHTFAALIDGGDIYQVPLTAGEPATYLATFEYPGRGGRINPLRPLAGSPLWAAEEPFLSAAEHNAFRGFFLESTTGELIPVTEFHPETDPTAIPDVSPDGRWFALRQGEPFSQQAEAFYIAPASDPGGGRVIDAATLLAWLPEEEMALLGTGERELIRLDLRSWTTEVLLEAVDLFDNRVIFDGEETIFVAGDHALYAVTLDGQEQGAMNSPQPASIAAAATRAMVFLQASNDYALWRWDPAP